MEQYILVVISAAILFIFVLIVTFLRRYKRCPSDRILVVYGRVGRKEEEIQSSKCIHGGASFIWPIIQDYQYLDSLPLVLKLTYAMP